jgi:hypothetical protein
MRPVSRLFHDTPVVLCWEMGCLQNLANQLPAEEQSVIIVEDAVSHALPLN